jgi:aquaporin Z
VSRTIAEAFGTFALVFAGCGAIVIDAQSGGAIGHAGISLVFGLVVMAMIYSVGNISGAHLNPAVSIGFVFARRLPARQLLPYVGGQLAGAFAAAVALRLLFPEADSLGETRVAEWTTPVTAAVFEVVITFLLMFVILNVSTGHMEKGIMAGVAVGGFVALAAMFGGPATGASMNPARSLAPALVGGHLDHLWIYVVAPIAGAILAHPTCRLIQGPECCATDPEGPC